MALVFSGGVGHKVSHGGGASGSSAMDDVPQGTKLAWIHPTAATGGVEGKIIQKGTGGEDGTYSAMSFDGDNGFANSYQRATSDLVASCTLANLPTYALNKDLFVAGVFDAAGAAGAQLLYGGDRVTAAAAVGTYSAQTAGSGAHTTDANAQIVVGNKNNDDHNFLGRISWVGIWNRVLTLKEIQEQQFARRPTNGCIFFVEYGLPATTCRDFSGQGFHGTVTSATNFAHVPLPHPFQSTRQKQRKIIVTAAAPAARHDLLLLGVG